MLLGARWYVYLHCGSKRPALSPAGSWKLSTSAACCWLAEAPSNAAIRMEKGANNCLGDIIRSVTLSLSSEHGIQNTEVRIHRVLRAPGRTPVTWLLNHRITLSAALAMSCRRSGHSGIARVMGGECAMSMHATLSWSDWGPLGLARLWKLDDLQTLGAAKYH